MNPENAVNSLGFAKSPTDTRVVVAMSGGVDSSVVAAELADKGYDVVGITLQLYDHGAAVGREGACCAGQDIEDARRVAAQTGLPHYVLDYESRFQESVIENFADSYLQGLTPLPCVRCNQTIKFSDLLQIARDLDADCLATGHYVRRVDGATGPELHKAVDPSKDQSYFLFATTREQLAFLRFPLGEKRKEDTRMIARELNVSVADKPDSQDICFVPDGSYTQVVEKLRPGAAEPGDIVDLNGRVLGRHDGIIHFTVGQRRGIGIGGMDQPLYVVRIDAERREVTVGQRAALARHSLVTHEMNWIGAAPLVGSTIAAFARIRNSSEAVPCQVTPRVAGSARIDFEAPQFGVNAGQAAVLYEGSRVLGGGWISHV